MVLGIGEINRDLPIKHGKDEVIGSIPIEGSRLDEPQNVVNSMFWGTTEIIMIKGTLQ